MKRIFVALFIAIIAHCAMAQPLYAGKILIDRPWMYTVPPTSTTAAVYFTLTNEGLSADRLLSASTPDAERVEIHTHIHDHGVMRMRPVTNGIALPVKQNIVFAPGGLHVMLFGIKQHYQPGDHFPITLRFEQAGEKTVNVAVKSGKHSSH